jgi:hypothetical protein
MNTDKRSIVWENFIPKESDATKAIYMCGIKCKAELSISESGTTSNLRKHLITKHKMLLEQLEEDKEEDQSTQVKDNKDIKQMLKIMREDLDSARSDKITKAITELMIYDNQPFSIVGNKAFKNLISYFEPKYVIPHRTTFSRTILIERYFQAEIKIKALLKTVNNISVIVDGWTSLGLQKYIGVLLNAIDSNFRRLNIKLGCLELNKCHTAKNMEEFINKLLDKFLISNKANFIVTDNANTMIALGKRSGKTRVGCFNHHRIQLIIKDAFLKNNFFDNILNKYRKLVGLLKRSHVEYKKLKDLAKDLDIKCLKVIQDVPTRWNSIYYLIDRLIYLKPVILNIISDNEITLIDSDWEVIEEVHK